MEILYFDAARAIKVHDTIIEISGGLPGIKDPGTIESSLEFIKNDDYYPTFEKKITRLVFTIAQFHMFVDGNKRSSISLGAYFLIINEYPPECVSHFIEEMENIVLWVAQGRIGEDFLEDLLVFVINDLPYPDEIRIKLYNSLQ